METNTKSEAKWEDWGLCSKQKNKIKPQEKKHKTNEMKVSNLPDTEFKAMLVKMLTELGRKEEHN